MYGINLIVQASGDVSFLLTAIWEEFCKASSLIQRLMVALKSSTKKHQAQRKNYNLDSLIDFPLLKSKSTNLFQAVSNSGNLKFQMLLSEWVAISIELQQSKIKINAPGV